MSTDLLARVHKLLALATSPNVHEAAAAAAAAQALVERHRLHALLDAEAEAKADAAADPVTDGREGPLERARRLRRWKVALAAGLAEANGCVAYSAQGGAGAREEWLLVAGRASDRAAIAAIWGWLVARLEWLSATEGAGRSRDWHEAFRIGAAEAVVGRLAAANAAEVASLPAGALVRVEPARAARAAVVTAFVARNLRLGPGRSLRVDARALAKGRAAGARLPLPEGR